MLRALSEMARRPERDGETAEEVGWSRGGDVTGEGREGGPGFDGMGGGCG